MSANKPNTKGIQRKDKTQTQLHDAIGDTFDIFKRMIMI